MAKKPSGLKITRTGGKFKCEWTLGETYTEQQFQFKAVSEKSFAQAVQQRVSGVGWAEPVVSWDKSETVSKTAKTKTITLSLTDYFPTKEVYLEAFEFRVRGKAGGSWSDWVEKTYRIYAPTAPTLTASWEESHANRTTFTWEGPSDAAQEPIYDVELQTVKKTNCPQSVTGLSEWSSATGVSKAVSGSIDYTESSITGSSRRIVRMRSRGAGGYSTWVYADHIYATPNTPAIQSYDVKYNSSAYTFNISATCKVNADAQHPIDDVVLEYCIGTPNTGMALPVSPTWNELASLGPSSQTIQLSDRVYLYTSNVEGTISKQITEQLDADECMWIRATAKHDASTAYSTVILAYKGKLSAPSSISVTDINTTTHRATVNATNNSSVPDSYLAVVYQPSNNPDGSFIVAIIPHGSSSVTVQCPDWSDSGDLGFKVYAVVGSNSYTTIDGVKHYTINEQMSSETSDTGGSIPRIPTGLTLSKTDVEGCVRARWTWTWTEADAAEISWSTIPNAWNSTEEPENYTIRNTHDGVFDIAGLTPGLTYYVRVRLISGDTYGPYSDTAVIYLAEKPSKPGAWVSEDTITSDGETTLYWGYESNDGTEQKYAAIATVTYTGGVPSYTQIKQVESGQSLLLDAKELGWSDGTTYLLAVKVTSGSNMESDWSDTVAVNVAAALECHITATSLVDGVLAALPLTMTVTGAGSGTTQLEIVRAVDFSQRRPDDTESRGYEGQAVFRRSYLGESQQTINKSDLIGMLDDTAPYYINAIVIDQYGRTAIDSVLFTVGWSHQAVMPVGSAVIDGSIAKITVGTPVGTASGDTVDIYRLSADKPVLVYKGASFGDVIVDPYPAIGQHGGYRLCFRTGNGDYITADQEYAWLDLSTDFESMSQYIEFDGNTILLDHNVDLSSTWEKSYRETKYLGGTIEGDWLAGTSKSGSIKAVKLSEEEVSDLKVLRDLAVYEGPVHIRTKEGASYNANVNYSEDESYSAGGKVTTVNLSISRSGEAEPDGMTLAEWTA